MIDPDILLSLLERVEAGESAVEVYQEFVFESEHVDNDEEEGE